MVPDELEGAVLGTSLTSYGWLWLVVGVVLIVSSFGCCIARSSPLDRDHRRRGADDLGDLVDALLPGVVTRRTSSSASSWCTASLPMVDASPACLTPQPITGASSRCLDVAPEQAVRSARTDGDGGEHGREAIRSQPVATASAIRSGLVNAAGCWPHHDRVPLQESPGPASAAGGSPAGAPGDDSRQHRRSRRSSSSSGIMADGRPASWMVRCSWCSGVEQFVPLSQDR